ncbi:MAG: hypothetical protein RIK87_08205 [Fuerstiella sp.]
MDRRLCEKETRPLFLYDVMLGPEESPTPYLTSTSGQRVWPDPE